MLTVLTTSLQGHHCQQRPQIWREWPRTFCCSHENAPGGRRSLQVGLFAANSFATGWAAGFATGVVACEVLAAPLLLPPVMVMSAQFLCTRRGVVRFSSSARARGANDGWLTNNLRYAHPLPDKQANVYEQSRVTHQNFSGGSAMGSK